MVMTHLPASPALRAPRMQLCRSIGSPPNVEHFSSVVRIASASARRDVTTAPHDTLSSCSCRLGVLRLRLQNASPPRRFRGNLFFVPPPFSARPARHDDRPAPRHSHTLQPTRAPAPHSYPHVSSLFSPQGAWLVTKWLLEAGAAVNCLDRFNRTPLEDAVRGDFIEVAKLLIDHGGMVFHRGKMVSLVSGRGRDGVSGE